LGAAMKNTSNGPRFLPAEIQNDPVAAHDALLHWDAQDEQILRLLARHPEHGGRLERLQRADQWLRDRAADAIVARKPDGASGPGPDLLLCPTAEDLYDFAGGPGARPLSRDRHLAIDRHLATCQACDGLAATLATAPPAALLLGQDEPAVAAPDFRAPAHDFRAPAPIPRFPVQKVLVPALAAAAIVLAIGAWRAFAPSTTRAAWPQAPLLRGEAADALIWPRGRILERTPALARFVPALAAAVPFEVAGATGAVRVQLVRTQGGAFDDPVPLHNWILGPQSSAPPAPLAAGHYTWKAWTQERGLDVELGSRDFEVVDDPALAAEIADFLAAGGEGAVVRAVARLDAAGFRADARALARTLPPSPERDAYLGRAPGR
jgi:hypothetical protein